MSSMRVCLSFTDGLQSQLLEMSLAQLSCLSVTDATQQLKLPADFARTMLLLPTILRIFEGITTASSLNRIYALFEQVMPISTLGQFTVPRLRLGASKA